MKKDILTSLLFFSIFYLFAPPSLLANDNKERLLPLIFLINAKSLKCSFEDGFFSTWENGEISSEKSTFDPIVFDSIDFASGKSRVIGRDGSADVMATLTRGGRGGAHFIETTNSGTWNTTTVFVVYSEEGEELFKRGLFFAVHSRHVSALLIQPMVSQYYGKCELWNID